MAIRLGPGYRLASAMVVGWSVVAPQRAAAQGIGEPSSRWRFDVSFSVGVVQPSVVVQEPRCLRRLLETVLWNCTRSRNRLSHLR